MELNLMGPRLRVGLQLNGKFNVVIGDTGSGKSYLCSVVEEIIHSRQYQKQLPLPICVGHTAATHLESWSEEYRGALLILDENQQGEHWNSKIDVMMRSHNYYILCTREGNPRIPYGVDTTFEMERTATSLRMVPAYRNIAHRNPHGFSSILTEDEGVGFKVVNKRTRLPVTPAKGKDKVVAALSTMTERTLVLIDLCGAGAALQGVIDAAELDRAIIYDSRSFEHEVLTSIFEKFKAPDYISNCLDAKSEDAFYTVQLKHLLHKLYEIKYTKDSEELATLLVEGKGVIGGRYIDLTKRALDVSKLYPFLNSSDVSTDAGPSEPCEDMKLR